jgi:hypothetical protein
MIYDDIIHGDYGENMIVNNQMNDNATKIRKKKHEEGEINSFKQIHFMTKAIYFMAK